jgi:predicted metal-binding membrane protein
MTSMMGATGALVGGALLIGAGLFQFTPLKHACLDHCRSPMSWLMSSWKDGWAGAVGMGMRHGLYCRGCCWMLMALLFAWGVMNLPWIAVLAGFVLLEKVVPAGAAVSRLSGLALIAWGAWLSATVS